MRQALSPHFTGRMDASYTIFLKFLAVFQRVKEVLWLPEQTKCDSVLLKREEQRDWLRAQRGHIRVLGLLRGRDSSCRKL